MMAVQGEKRAAPPAAHLWLPHLYALCARFAHLGVVADLGTLALPELWGLYRHLCRMAESA